MSDALLVDRNVRISEFVSGCDQGHELGQKTIFSEYEFVTFRTQIAILSDIGSAADANRSSTARTRLRSENHPRLDVCHESDFEFALRVDAHASASRDSPFCRSHGSKVRPTPLQEASKLACHRSQKANQRFAFH